MTKLNAAERQAQRMLAMEEEAAAITPGEEWIYRAQDRGRSQRVLVVGPDRTASTVRMEVQLLDGERAGQTRFVGLRRLKAPWSDVEAYDALDRKRRQIEDSHHGFHPEYGAAREAVRLLVPSEVAGWPEWYVSGFVVRDRDTLASLCQVPFGELVPEEDSIEAEDDLLIGAASFIRIAKAACAAQPDSLAAPLLLRDRREILRRPAENAWAAQSEEHETDLLHEWSGIQRFNTRLHLMALENEAAWQRSLVGAAVDTLRRCGAKSVAANLERLSRDGPPDEEDPDEDQDWDESAYAVPW